MEIVASLPTNTRGATGGTKKHIEEWSRLDNFSGVLEHARVEADHWTSNTSNSRHRFGKVVDSRARNLADGSVQQQQQTKQLEVFQAHIPGGSVQVIRSHTSTSSSWHNSKVLQSKSYVDRSFGIGSNFFNRSSKIMESPIADLEHQQNLVNLEPEKTKINVARYLLAHRPLTTRTKSIKTSTSEKKFFSKPPTMCSETEIESEERLNAIAIGLKSSLSESPDAVNNVIITNGVANDGITEHAKLEKKKSVSDENLNIEGEKENSNPWKRDSKVRWSFQYPRSKLKGGKFDVDTAKNELESVLERVLKRKGETIERSVQPEIQIINASPKLCTSSLQKRNSFVSAQALKETKQRLRKLNEEERKIEITPCENEETDDGICTEIKELGSVKEGDIVISLVKEKHDSCGTGSLECRSKHKSEDWYDRRKSYGFESVYKYKNNAANMKSIVKNNLSADDGGLCHSSELELLSTPIVKKLTEVNGQRMRQANELEMNHIHSEYYERIGVSQVSELLNKFEQQSLSRVNPSTVFSVRRKPSCFSDSFPNTTRTGNVAELIKTLREQKLRLESQSTHTSVARLSSPDSQQQPIPSKRHSIACDDATYVSKLSLEEAVDRASPSVAVSLSSPASSCLVDTLNTNFSTVINVNKYGGDISLSSPASGISDSTDTKKPKKVEFNMTDVHFAVAEPGKTNEKSATANLHCRKKRSSSVSPEINSPLHCKLEHEKHPDMNIDDPSRLLHHLNNVDLTDNCCNTQFTSSTCDNGLAVRMSSSATPNNDFRGASWSIIDTIDDGKLGYTTKVNFGEEGVTVVANTKSHQLKNLETSQRCSTTNSLDVMNDHHYSRKTTVPEKLIVRIGGSTTGVVNTCTMENHLTNNFCESLYEVQFGGERENKLNCTSLIVGILKSSINGNVQITAPANRVPGKHYSESKMEKKISELNKNNECFVEQPSTYITEMNKLQHKHRIERNSSLDMFVQGKNDDELKSIIYNTIPPPTAKNGFTRPKVFVNDFPSVLNAFDDLYQSISDAIKEDKKNASVKRVNSGSVKQDIPNKCTNFRKYSSSQSLLPDKIISRDNDDDDDGDVSDDSLKADEEVRSYMNTAIMEEYENEIRGSWSRKRYHKYVKSNSAARDEISEKSHFKPLRSEEEMLKTVTGAMSVDIKRPQITAVAVNLTPSQSCGSSSSLWTGEANQKKCTTSVLLNNNIPVLEKPPTTLSEPNSVSNERAIIAHLFADSKNVQLNTSPRIITSVQPVTKIETIYKPVKIIRHDDRINVSAKRATRGHWSDATKKETFNSSRARKSHEKTSASLPNGSFHRRTGYDRDKLFSSGRDSWLNLPKEYKFSGKKLYGDCTKIRPTQMPPEEFRRSSSERHSRKSAVDNVLSAKLANTGSAEEWLKRSFRKPFMKPMTTISEKSRLQVDGKTDTRRGFKFPSKAPVTRTTSNSSLESYTNASEFRAPILKTEERSRRRAARMMQRASSREALMNLKSSSEDITSENEVNRVRSIKAKSSTSQKKLKSSKLSKAEQKLSARSDCNRLIQQKTAKMESNIFKIKKNAKDKNVVGDSCSRTRLYAANTITKSDQQGHRDMGTKISQITRITQRNVVNQSKDIHKVSHSREVLK